MELHTYDNTNDRCSRRILKICWPEVVRDEKLYTSANIGRMNALTSVENGIR